MYITISNKFRKKFVFFSIFIVLAVIALMPILNFNAYSMKYNGTNAAISLTLEHAELNQFEAVNKYMNDMNATYAVIVQRIGDEGFMTAQQLLDLQDQGSEIASHSETHLKISELTANDQLLYEIVQSKADLENMGFDIFGYIPPFNKSTEKSLDLIHLNYTWTQLYDPITNSTYDPKYTSIKGLEYSKKNFGVFDIPSFGVGNDDTLKKFSDVKKKIDYAIENKLWIALKFHTIDNTPGKYDATPELFNEIIQYVREKRDAGELMVVTRSQGLGLDKVNKIPPLNIPDPCFIPTIGNMTIQDSCAVIKSEEAPANVFIQNNSTLVIPNDVIFDIDFVNHFIKIESGSGILIENNGTLN